MGNVKKGRTLHSLYKLLWDNFTNAKYTNPCSKEQHEMKK